MGQPQHDARYALTFQAARFVLVGAAAAAVHFLALAGWVQLAHMPPVYANILAFLIAFCVSFAGHYRLTFRRQNPHSLRASLWRWFATSLGGFLLNQLIFMLGLQLFGSAAYQWIWLLATLAAMFLTFVLGKFWAFGRKKQKDAAS